MSGVLTEKLKGKRVIWTTNGKEFHGYVKGFYAGQAILKLDCGEAVLVETKTIREEE